jgi:hydroxyacylglutathione hydrolase
VAGCANRSPRSISCLPEVQRERGRLDRLLGGMTSSREDKLDVARIERMTVPELHGRRERDGVQVLDVREQSEWDAGHIPDSVHRPYHDISDVPDGIDPARPVAVICGSGQRSAVAASTAKA